MYFLLEAQKLTIDPLIVLASTCIERVLPNFGVLLKLANYLIIKIIIIVQYLVDSLQFA